MQKGRKLIAAVMAGLLTLVMLSTAIGCTPAAPPKTEKPEEKAEKVILLGQPTSLYVPHARDQVKAVDLAIEEINAAGGVDVGGEAYKFDHVVTDTRGAEPGVPVHDAIIAAEKLITEKKPDFLVGTFHRSEVHIAAMDILAKHKILAIGGITQTPKVSKMIAKNPEKYKYIFRSNNHAVQVGELWGKFMAGVKERYGFDKAFFIPIDLEWARAVSKAMSGFMGKYGWETVGIEPVPPGMTDFSAPLNEAKNKGADIIFVVHELPSCAASFKQWKAMKIPSLFAGIYTPPITGPRQWDVWGDALNYVLFHEPLGGAWPVEGMPETGRFINHFKEKYKAPPETNASGVWGYIQPYLLRDAIERAGTLETDAVAQALLETDMKFMGQRLRFNKKTHTLIWGTDPEKGGVLTIHQWLEGKAPCIFPPAITEKELTLPPWMK